MEKNQRITFLKDYLTSKINLFHFKKMETEILKINPRNPEKSKIRKAAEIIKKGDVVAFPTETVYGLGANALDKKAIKKIFIAKGRPQDNPLIVHIHSKKNVSKLVDEIPKNAKKLMKKFWPGPLTIILKKNKSIPKNATANLPTIAIRMPKNKIALELIKQSKVPLVAPSANISGKPSPTKSEHVIEDLNGKIGMIIEGGKTDIGLESTVIDLTQKIPEILRPGKITRKQIENVIGKINVNQKSSKCKSPGTKYKHYSPKAKVIITKDEKDVRNICKKNPNKKIKQLKYPNEKTMAKNLFDDFRKADKEGYDIILVKEIKNDGLGHAIMNRLKKACSK